MPATREQAAALLRNMKSLSAVLPKENRIADVTQFPYAPPVNPDYPISTLPEHLHSTSLSHAKTT